MAGLKENTKKEVWFKGHGHCSICGKPLYRDLYTMIKGNLGEYAHIVAASYRGPRGDKILSPKLVNDPDNIILLCLEHHTMIDRNPQKYTIDYLKRIKREHEERIEMLTSIPPSNHTLIVCYNPIIGKKHIEITQEEMYNSLFPEKYPSGEPIILDSQGTYTDNDTKYWLLEPSLLEDSFKERLGKKLLKASHITVFALAPQPLLIKLGSLLGDINNVEVLQKHRDPEPWKWVVEYPDNAYEIIKPTDRNKEPILILALSGKEIIDRAKKQFGSNYSYWILTCENAYRDMMVSKKQLLEFKQIMRKLIGEINESTNNPIKIIPAIPNSCAIELGRLRLPKSDNHWVLYDKTEDSDLYVETITI